MIRGESTWADQILTRGPSSVAGRCGPYYIDETTGCLYLKEELRRRPRDPNAFLADSPSLGWKTFKPLNQGEIQAWCPPGAADVLSGRKYPMQVVGGQHGHIQLYEILVRLWSGTAFAYKDLVFLLPTEAFDRNAFTYEKVNGGHLTVAVAFRGHTRSYSEIITPSVLRSHRNPTPERLFRYSAKEIYASNLLRQAFFELGEGVLSQLQCRGVLQHHKTIGDTGLLDLSWDVDVAKWFAVNEWVDGAWRSKQFGECLSYWDAVEDSSCVYQVVIRVIGGTREPLPIQFHGVDVELLPENILPLSSQRPERQRGYGVWGIGPEDSDRRGMVMNITEWRYHPEIFPHGWEAIGGPTIKIGSRTFSPSDDSSVAWRDLFPAEPSWFELMLEQVETRVNARFGRDL